MTDHPRMPIPEGLSEQDPLECVCLRCGHRWRSDTVRMLLDAGMQDEAAKALEKAPPRRCASCKSSYWNVPPIRKPNDHLGANTE